MDTPHLYSGFSVKPHYVIVLEIKMFARPLTWWLLNSLKAKTMRPILYRTPLNRFINTLFFPCMVSPYVKIQHLQPQFYWISPSQGLVHVFLRNIGQRRGFLFLKYKARRSTIWSQCPCIRLATATPWCRPWVSSNVSLYFPYFHAHRLMYADTR